MEFPNLGEYHDNLSLEDAVRIYQEIPAERMNGIKGIGFELKDGSDYEAVSYTHLDVYKRQTTIC